MLGNFQHILASSADHKRQHPVAVVLQQLAQTGFAHMAVGMTAAQAQSQLLRSVAAFLNALLQRAFFVVHALGGMQQFAIDAYREAGVGLECLRLSQSLQQRSGGIAQCLRKPGLIEHAGYGA